MNALTRLHRPRGITAQGLSRHRHHGGVVMEQWQYEVTAGGRLWYLVDSTRRTLWVKAAGAGHPKVTD